MGTQCCKKGCVKGTVKALICKASPLLSTACQNLHPASPGCALKQTLQTEGEESSQSTAGRNPESTQQTLRLLGHDGDPGAALHSANTASDGSASTPYCTKCILQRCPFPLAKLSRHFKNPPVPPRPGAGIDINSSADFFSLQKQALHLL